MCGIAGLLSTDGRPIDRDLIAGMTSRLVHRGPDGAGIFTDSVVGLGHRRLAIIDPDGGHQPLTNEDGTVHVIFNGEIYNYRELTDRLTGLRHTFRTASDTEVLVHAWEQWGPSCVEHLRGMFAFAVWDSRQRKLFLARDRTGIKPLLYSWQDGWFAFASEMQALTCLPGFQADLNPQAIDQYLHYQYIPAPDSIYRQVCKLPPGHTLLIDLQNVVRPEPVRYWRLSFRPDRSLSESQWLERLDEALEETIRVHLVSDVPFGAFLSGGLDSSTVVAYMSRLLNRSVKAFCIGHSDAAYDERNWAAEAARVTAAEFHEEVVQPDGLQLLPDLVRHFGEPFADSSAIPTWYVSRLARQHVPMVLSGDGGDELFAGYRAYATVLCSHRSPESTVRRLRHHIANGARRMGLWPNQPTIADTKYSRTAIMGADQRLALWRPEFHNLTAQTRNQFDRHFQQVSHGELLNNLQAFDVETYIPFDNLTKVDVASMCHGLEVRVPFLDHRFMEIVAQIPPELKLCPNSPDVQLEHLKSPSDVTGKYLLKQNALRFFSAEFVHRPKRGFEVPIRNWFAGLHREQLQERLLSTNSRLHELFCPEALQSIVTSAARDKVAAWRAWSLLVLDEWLSQQLIAASA